MPATSVDATLELHQAVGAFGELEAWLRERGFFARGGEQLVADLYLGYGLSQCIRRRGAPSPPEPCPALPLLACSVRQDEETQGAFHSNACIKQLFE